MGGFTTIGAVAPHYLSDTTIHLGSLLKSQLEYPTVDVNLAYLCIIGKAVLKYAEASGAEKGILTVDSFTDKAIVTASFDVGTVLRVMLYGRYVNPSNTYISTLDSGYSAADHQITSVVNGTYTTLATESVDLTSSYAYTLYFQIVGSSLKSVRSGTATLSATDTSLASGSWGVGRGGLFTHNYPSGIAAMLKNPSSAMKNATTIIEVETIGSGRPDDPFRPSLSQNMAEITSMTGLPESLYMEAKRYEILKSKGFTDDEIMVLLGYIPQHQVDMDAVTWGAFEFSEKSPTNIIMVYGDNPYQAGAIDRQKSVAKRSFTPPRSYDDAVALYNQLKNDYPHWLAGKDNFTYQVLGYEELECLAVVDFYYGELIEHKTHYDQLKRVPDWELRNTLRMWSDRLERAKPDIPHDEYVKHRGKLDKILRLGW